MEKYIIRALDVFKCEIRNWYKDFDNTDDAVKYAKEVLKGTRDYAYIQVSNGNDEILIKTRKHVF
jgi:hypothetical protein|nr:MAG TPA: hypothetical protein [Caudoviricetes sp.]